MERIEIDALRWFCIGVAIWLPSNAIVDDTPVFVAAHGALFAAKVSFAGQGGNALAIAVLSLHRQFSRRVVLALLVTQATVLVAVGGVSRSTRSPHLVYAVATACGFCGSLASTIAWGACPPGSVRLLSIGMSASSVISGAMTQLQKAGSAPTFGTAAFFAAAGVVSGGFALAGAGSNREADAKASAQPMTPHTTWNKLHRGSAAMFLLYATNYALPASLARAAKNDWEMRMCFIAWNAGDIAGRFFDTCAMAAFCWSAACAFCGFIFLLASVPPGTVGGHATATACFALSAWRGAAITHIYSMARAIGTDDDGRVLSMAGHAGSFAGTLAMATAIAVAASK